MSTGPNTGFEIKMPGRQDKDLLKIYLILFSGAPNLIVTLSPPFA